MIIIKYHKLPHRAWYTLSVHAPNNYINEFHHKSWHVMQYDKNKLIILMIYYGDDIDGVWNASLTVLPSQSLDLAFHE